MLTFTALTVSDKNKIEKFTRDFEPYSDFNFTSLYSWSLHSQVKYCLNKGVLYLILPDYITQKPVYSFLTDKDPNTVAATFAKSLNKKALKYDLLPQDVAERLDDNLFEIKEDRGSFDYILDTKAFSSCKGKAYADIRYKFSRFDRLYDNLELLDFIPNDSDQLKDALVLAKTWANKKAKPELYKDEIYAFSRFLNFMKDNRSIETVAYKNKNRLVAFAAYETVGNYAIGHFLKYDPTYAGIYYKLVHEVCKRLSDNDVEMLNIEQDLDIRGLRQAKMHLRPLKFLKKYQATPL